MYLWLEFPSVFPLPLHPIRDFLQTYSQNLSLSPNMMYTYITHTSSQEGDGLCCGKGKGKYELYSLGNLIAQGDDFGTLEEHYFFIDPLDYYVIDSGSGGSSSSSTSDGASSNNMMPNNGGSGNMSPNSGMVAFTEEADPISIPASNFCGVNFTDAADRCHLTCMDSAECPVGEACFRNTPCEDMSGSIMSENSVGGGAAEATGTEGPTTSPVPSISYTPSTSLEPTSSPRPTIMPLPLVAQEILDQSAWFCGKGESN